jgi:hypothetical protein
MFSHAVRLSLLRTGSTRFVAHFPNARAPLITQLRKFSADTKTSVKAETPSSQVPPPSSKKPEPEESISDNADPDPGIEMSTVEKIKVGMPQVYCFCSDHVSNLLVCFVMSFSHTEYFSLLIIQFSSAWELSKPRIKTVGLMTLLAGVASSLLMSMVSTIEYFASLSFANVGAVGFGAGFLSAVALAGSYTYARSKFLIMRPERMLNVVLKRCVSQINLTLTLLSQILNSSHLTRPFLLSVRSDAAVQQRYGPDVTLGRFQAFAYASVPPSVSGAQSIMAVFKSKKSSSPKPPTSSPTSSSTSSAEDLAPLPGVETSDSDQPIALSNSPIARLNDYLHKHKSLQLCVLPFHTSVS